MEYKDNNCEYYQITFMTLRDKKIHDSMLTLCGDQLLCIKKL